MNKLTIHNRHGQLVDLSTVAATRVKNEFGAILDQVVRQGPIVITRHDRPQAVLLSMAEFEALASARGRSLADLGGAFDWLLSSMQTPQARKGVDSGFHASPAELGQTSVDEARASRPVKTKRVRGRTTTAQK